MRPVADLLIKRIASGAIAGAMVFPFPARSQTIADYSRSQRAVIEAEIAKNTAKAMAAAQSASAPLAASAAGAGNAQGLVSPGADRPPPAASSSASPTAPAAETAAQWTVSGVFLSSSRALAEVVVDGSAYLLAPGQAVPGTPWHVQSVTANKVVISGAKAALSHRSRSNAGSATKVFRIQPGSP